MTRWKHPLKSPSVQHTEQKYNPRQRGKHTLGITVSLCSQRAPPDDQRCVVSLQPTRHTIRYIYTTVSGQYCYADWRECNVFRETVSPYIFFRNLPRQSFWWTSRCLEYVRRLSSTQGANHVAPSHEPCSIQINALHWRFQKFELLKLELTRSSRHGCFAH